MFKGFRDFLFRGNVIDLAVAVVVGAAFNAIVQALVKDIITPFIGVFGGTPDFSSLTWTVNNSQFFIGDFINAIISFLIIAAVIYFMVIVPMNRVTDKVGPKKEEKKETTKECPFCLSKIPLKASRCAYCTSQLPKK